MITKMSINHAQLIPFVVSICLKTTLLVYEVKCRVRVTLFTCPKISLYLKITEGLHSTFPGTAFMMGMLNF
jgi:hypothetical protein